MLSSFLYLLGLIAALFWLIQLIDLFIRDLRDFESHTHKLTWFLVLVSGSVVGAVWYYFWTRRIIAAKAERTKS
ncbi:MAG: PLDc N-terminal domain-containing protein [Sedimentisphaerales bacterium]|jgi:hypothetical protein|nr:PLDc N-terminal domain-containing protein [Sedimentisphaerales bacterium]HNY78364.1 PLDc N-terminal domain-containing protein [Sedimentisphaerales bacterium]HOC63548.1 PLDc N-terminal domain-containing protein [Sedimentisphaerales bacterium]HOH62831.1 PLDc N-terminal domain-containing protein [Sedimentisphaerales bacterium]HPY51751.1 PLDc N-terminal domain-containing protein [Sedimentisphaerales bacterium]